MTRMIFGMKWREVAVLTAVLCAATSSAATFDLWAKQGTVTMPDGALVEVWGYAASAAGPVMVPGPRLVVPPGDTTLQITLHNNLAEATSIVIPGLTASLSPVFVTDPQGRRRVKSFTTETPAGDMHVYTFAVRPGTYLYQSGTMPGKQVTLGLYGAVTNDYAAGTAYNGVAYTNELVILYSELDPGLAAAPDIARPLTYNPRYFLVNGQPYSGSSAALSAPANQPTLIRFLNAGLKSHSPQLLGSHMSLVAEDGNLYPYPRVQYTALLAAGKTKDAIWTPPAAGSYSISDAFHCLTTNGALGGGLLSRVNVTDSANIPVAVADAYSTDEDTPLSVAAPGVLANDIGPATLGAVLVEATAHGSLTLNPDGSFSYAPALNFNGADQFTYRAHSSGSGLDGNLATVSITVNSVADPAAAVDDSAVTAYNTAVTINVLANDTNPDGLAPAIATPPANGAAVVNPANTITYTPAGFSGTDSFTYTLGGSTATVTVTVQPPVNQAPVAADDTATTPRATAVLIVVLANDSDPDGTLAPSSVRLAGDQTSITTQQKGTASVNLATGAITYTPRNGFRGSDSFTYTVRDNLGVQSNAATVTVNVVR